MPGVPDGRVPTVRIHYLRPPDRTDVYAQDLVHDPGHVKVTLAAAVELERPLEVGGRTVLEPGADAVWFTFPGAWHDIGRFHLANGTFTGIYANVLVPCVFEPGGVWHTTDLFLDLWLPAEAWAAGAPWTPLLLDEDELTHAEREGWVEPELAERGRAEARRLIEEARAGRWPPPVVGEWTREQALRAAGR